MAELAVAEYCWAERPLQQCHGGAQSQLLYVAILT